MSNKNGEPQFEIWDKVPVPPKRFTPYGKMIAVHVHQVKDRGSKLVLPDGAMRTDDMQACVATVIATGPKCEQVKEGDQVVLSPIMMGANILHDGHRYVTFEEECVCGILLEKINVELRKD